MLALDEIDVLPAPDVAEVLRLLCSLPKAAVVSIAPSRRALLQLPEAVRSRLAPRQVPFPRYGPDEMREILLSVLQRALKPGASTPEALHKIVGHAYGDARRALALLRHAVQRAEEARAPRLEADHLKPANMHDQADVDEQLERLGIHHRLLHDLLLARGPLSRTALEAAYREACAKLSLEPVASRTVSKYLLQLRQLGILTREYRPGTGEWVFRLVGK